MTSKKLTLEDLENNEPLPEIFIKSLETRPKLVLMKRLGIRTLTWNFHSDEGYVQHEPTET